MRVIARVNILGFILAGAVATVTLGRRGLVYTLALAISGCGVAVAIYKGNRGLKS